MLPFALLALARGGQAGLPTLLAPKAVDLRVKEIRWHPRGDALLYSRDEPDGVGLGLYGPRDLEGQVVLRLHAGDQWTCRWLPGAPACLITVESKGQSDGRPTRSVAMYLCDVSKKTAKEVFARTIPAEQALRLDANVSPTLVHAVVTLTEGERTSRFVLPLNGGRLVPAPDIDRAVASGLSGPGWSSQGTAMYGPGKSGGRSFVVENSNRSDSEPEIVGQSTTSFSINMRFQYESLVESFAASKSPSAPPEGTASLEVVPTNGVLRPVRSPGPWAYPAPLGPLLATEIRTMRLDADGLRTDTAGLCLVGGTKSSPWRLLVAPRSDWGSLSPDGTAIVYTVDGALFVRGIDRR